MQSHGQAHLPLEGKLMNDSVVIAWPMIHHGPQASSIQEHEHEVNPAKVVTNVSKLHPGKKEGKAVSLVEVSSPQSTVAVRTEFCWFEDCVCRGLKKKRKKRRHRCFSTRHSQLNQQNMSSFSRLQPGCYRAELGFSSSPGSA